MGMSIGEFHEWFPLLRASAAARQPGDYADATRLMAEAEKVESAAAMRERVAALEAQAERAAGAFDDLARQHGQTVGCV